MSRLNRRAVLEAGQVLCVFGLREGHAYKPGHGVNRRGRGFTLLEVIVAMTIFGAGVLGVTAAFSLSAQASASSYRLAEAARLAERQMVLALHEPAGQLQPARGNDGVFAWTSVYESAPEGLTLIVVTVRWSDRGDEQQFVLRRLFSPRQGGSG